MNNFCRFLAVLLMSMNAVAFAQNAVPTQLTISSPYFAKVGDTVFVSGHFKFWLRSLYKLLPASYSDVDTKAYYDDPSRQVDTVVFVNDTTPGFEDPGGAYRMIERLKKYGISTVIAGRCDLFCARMFLGGKTRLFAQDVGKEQSRFSIQVPIDYETRKLERRFPNTQLAVFALTVPQFAATYKDMLAEGFTKPVDETGGLNIYADQPPQYCDSFKKPTTCKEYSGLDAFKMGLTTAPGRVTVTLPPGFPAPTVTGYADINDVKAVPSQSATVADGYMKFLKRSAGDGRAFAISEDPVEGQWGLAWAGLNAPGRALASCQTKSTSPCRLYAVDNDVVW